MSRVASDNRRAQMPLQTDAELLQLNRHILTMGSLVEQRLDQAVESLIAGDAVTAKGVRKGDDDIDAMEIDIEEECLRILALGQPVATDLRFVLAVLRINTEFERIGDLARNIAKRTMHIEKHDGIELPPAVVSMANETRRMFGRALAALAEKDPREARRICRADRRIDDLQSEVFAWVHKQIPLHIDRTEQHIDLLSVARALERISDQCTNVAEEVIFLTEGTVVRHQDMD